jgi:hypothetical protein
MENRRFVDQRRAAVEQFMADHRDELIRQGVLVATFRRRGDRILGPYHQLTCRRDGRQVAVYLGSDEALIGDVRERLARLQQSRSEEAKLHMVRRAVRSQARAARQQLDAELVKLGLYRKGHEIRGWRGMLSTKAASAAISSDVPPVFAAD